MCGSRGYWITCSTWVSRQVKMAAQVLKGEKKASEMNFETDHRAWILCKCNQSLRTSECHCTAVNLADSAVESFDSISK